MTDKTPLQKIKFLIIARHALFAEIAAPDYAATSGDDIDAAYEALEEKGSGEFTDAREEVRSNGDETDLPCDSDRHLESSAVAERLPDGSWVGWTYWYGGGKHSEPSAVDWMEDAYDVNCVVEQRPVNVFSLPEPASA